MNYLKPITDQVNAMVYGFLAILPNLAIAAVVLVVTGCCPRPRWRSPTRWSGGPSSGSTSRR